MNKIIIISLINILLAQINLSPNHSATAQTFGTFSRGMDAIHYNPANLAYQFRILKNTTFTKKHRTEETYRINIQNSVSIVEADSIANYIKEFLRRGGLRCEILSSGIISIGDEIKIL